MGGRACWRRQRWLSAMIDASRFAAHYNAFWTQRTPTSEHFVRRLNLELAQRWEPPLSKPDLEIRAAFIAEVAFARFSLSIQGLEREILEHKALSEARRRLLPLTNDPGSLNAPLTETEEQQAKSLGVRLAGFFRFRELPLALRPVFPGCGIIDASEGDVVSGTTLFEIKAVERPFRGFDLRQLLTYCALNHASQRYSLAKLGIYNPRRGLYVEMNIDQVCREMAGITAQEFFEDIVHAVSSGEVSR